MVIMVHVQVQVSSHDQIEFLKKELEAKRNNEPALKPKLIHD